MRRLLRMVSAAGLRARLLGIVLIALLPMVGLLYVYANAQNATALQRARADVQDRLSSDAASIRDLVDGSRATLETFGITFAIQTRDWALVQGNADRLHALHPDYLVVSVAEPNGVIIASSTDQTGSVNVSRQAFFTDAVRTHSLTVSNNTIEPQLHRRAIVVSYPAYDRKGTLLAVEYVALDPSLLRSHLSLAAATAASAEDVIDASGTIVTRKPALASVEGSLQLADPLVRTVVKRRQGQTTAMGFDGVSREFYFAPIFPSGEGELFLASGYSPSLLFAAQSRSFTATLLGFGGVGLFALIVAWLVGTFSIYRPTRKLTDAAGRLAEGDFTARSEVASGAGEFGELGRRFDAMAQSIQEQIRQLEHNRGELRALNLDLEDRVRRRTADLQTANRELEAFNYSVSHDLRAPLRAIDGFSQALLEDYTDKLDEEGRDNLGRVKAAANRMGELIDSLLALSRLTRVEMTVRQVDMSAMAREVVDELRSRDPERDVDVTIGPGIVGEADATLLRSVFDNLIGNAWKFTANTAGARIEFGASAADGEQVFFVRDNGAGFDMAYVDKLFGAFQRLHDQRDYPGTGVGLATVARVVHRHGGRVWADGHPGEGATFYFTLR